MAARPHARPRIVFLNNQGLGSAGGGVTILRHLVRDLSALHDVTVLSFDAPAPGFDGARQMVLPAPPPPPGPVWRAAPLWRDRHLRRAMRQGEAARAITEAEAVVALDCHFASALRGLRVPLIYLSLSCIPRMEYMANPGPGSVPRFLQYAWLERRIARGAARVVVASRTHGREMQRAEMLGRFSPDVLAPVFPSETAPRDAAPAARRTGGVVTILGGGRLVPVKNYAAFVDLAARLADLPCRFLLAGDGPERDALERRAAGLRLDNLGFLGQQPGLGALLAGADLFLHPSSYESFGMAVFEAMLAGVPPICARGRAVTACAEFVQDGVSGRFADFDDLDGAAALLRALILDPDGRAALGARARAAAKAMLEADYAARFRAILTEVLDARR